MDTTPPVSLVPGRLRIALPPQNPAPSPEPVVAAEVEENAAPLIEIENLSLHYRDAQALFSIGLPIVQNAVTALIGPSGCGKSSLLRCINRMNDAIPGARVSGAVRLLGQDIYDKSVDPNRLRRHVGMVFQRSNPFPQSIHANVAYGIHLHKLARTRNEMQDMVEASLQRVGLWDEVKDRLNENALNLSGGQQQRLCIARAIAVNPRVVLMDEPGSALDPLATARIEELIGVLKQDYTIVIVTHNLQQAGRCSDYTAFLYMGYLIEYDYTDRLFSNPANENTENYISGRFG